MNKMRDIDLRPSPLPDLSLHDGLHQDQIDATQVVSSWLSQLEQVFAQKSFNNLSELFIHDAWWRDIVGLSWDFVTKHGPETIRDYLVNAPSHLSELRCATTVGMKPTLMDMGGMVWIQSGFTFRTPHGDGKGFVRLANVSKSEWKAWTVFTQLLRLDFQNELEPARVGGIAATQQVASNHRDSLVAAYEKELQVLIIGAGQSGCALGAQLKSMGIKTLLVEKSARVGDAWRARYDTVKLHTPRYTDYYPFLKKPDSWPRWLGRDMIADFMEHYSQLMGLNILLKTSVKHVEYDTKQKRYHVELQGPDGTIATLSPRHVVLATGLVSNKPLLPEIPGLELFQGKLYHSVEHKSASHFSDLGHKKVVIIGSGASGHDLAADFVTHGAQHVTMVQRSPIFSITAEATEQFMLRPWNTEGLTTEDADVIGNSIPLPVIRTMSAAMSQMMCARDRDMIEGLKKAGLKLDTGENGVGLAEYQLVRGGNFYIDQGANQMIIDGRIKIAQCQKGVREIRAGGLTLADGTDLDADILVLATGFHRNVLNVEEVVGKEVSEKVGSLGFLDEEQERKGWWRPTGMPGFWYMTGSFLWSRQYSLSLALQIAAVERGLNQTHYN